MPEICARCGAPLPPEAGLCPRCFHPVTARPPARPARAPASRTARELLLEYASLDQVGALLASPRFWLLYSLAAMPVVFQWMEIGAQGMFFYFAFFWAVVFHRLVVPERGAVRMAVWTYFMTSFAVMPLLILWIQLPPNVTGALIQPDAPLLARLLGFVFGVGLREEIAKAAPVALLLWLAGRAGRSLGLRRGLFLGAVSGVTFAAVENIEYLRQFEEFDFLRRAMGFYTQLTFEGGVTRLLLTPFMHGAWSGIAGYFLARAALDPSRRRALVVAGLFLAATMHGLYNTFAGSPLATLLAIAFAFHVLVKCIARATEEPSVAAVAERV